jgi:hypothetical protein
MRQLPPIYCDHETQLYCFYDAEPIFWLFVAIIGAVIGLVAWKKYTSRKKQLSKIRRD